MYGTLARMRIKPGSEFVLEELEAEWYRTRGQSVPGAGPVYILAPDGDLSTRWLVAIFDDKESYAANADHPDQDAWYRRVREHLVADPEWIDGTWTDSRQA
jgi:antibiotic biosynthesis monooxygenase (ABM) superfamily enzyme